MRHLRPGEPVPEGQPTTRSVHTNGYVILLWRVGREEWVRAYEHRVVMGNPIGEVHHKNEIKADNRPENLEVLDGTTHRRERHTRWDVARAIELHGLGWSIRRIGKECGVDHGRVSRSLRVRGVVPHGSKSHANSLPNGSD